MNKVIHRSDTRGKAEYGWLTSRHTFSFANYYNPDRIKFGKLCVLNDDIVESSMGFDTHHHDNMEIISIPLVGTLRHKDSIGNEHVISRGDIQIMSAGTGITHSEYNASSIESVNFLQIWILPKKINIHPRYDQKTININSTKNEFKAIVTPNQENDITVWINQDAFFSLANLDTGKAVSYQCNFDNPAVYIFLISGEINIDGDILHSRDGIALSNLAQIKIYANSASTILCIETTF